MLRAECYTCRFRAWRPNDQEPEADRCNGHSYADYPTCYEIDYRMFPPITDNSAPISQPLMAPLLRDNEDDIKREIRKQLTRELHLWPNNLKN